MRADRTNLHFLETEHPEKSTSYLKALTPFYFPNSKHDGTTDIYALQFRGNDNTSDYSYEYFNPPMRTQGVRLWPQSWYLKPHTIFHIFGCPGKF